MSNISKISLGGEVYDITLTQEKFNALLKGGSPGLAYELSGDGTYATCTGIGDCTDTDVVIASEYKGVPVTSIGMEAFLNCSSLTSVIVPSSVISLDWGAFQGCSNLKSITLGDNITDLGAYTFEGCKSLKNIEIPKSVTIISLGLFQNCSSLASITIPNKVTGIAAIAFSGCTSLMSIEIPNTITAVEHYAFDSCTSLKSITIPDSVALINAGTFENCSNLTIYCEAVEQPAGWEAEWNPKNRPVIWGSVMDLEGVNDKFALTVETGTGDRTVQQTPRADKVTIAEGETTPYFNFTGHADANSAGRIKYGAVGNYSASFNGRSAALNKHAFAINNSTIAKGEESFAQGYETIAEGNSSVATGSRTWAMGLASHTEGENTYAEGEGSHAEGALTKAIGRYSHAEGERTTTNGDNSHAEGALTQTGSFAAHAEGNATIADTNASHTEGSETKVVSYILVTDTPEAGDGTTAPTPDYSEYESIEDYRKRAAACAHAEGNHSIAMNYGAHAEGVSTKAYGHSSHTEGWATQTGNLMSKEQDGQNYQIANPELGLGAHAEGYETKAIANYSHAEGFQTEATGVGTHAEGSETHATEMYAHAEGYNTEASGQSSHSEGEETEANGTCAHAEGFNTKASGSSTHAEGHNIVAMADRSHAEGDCEPAAPETYDYTFTFDGKTYNGKNGAYGAYSHREGRNTLTLGDGSHVEGIGNIAYGLASHAEGFLTEANGIYSHASGLGTKANGDAQTVVGMYNTDDPNAKFIVGAGYSDNRQNAFTAGNDGTDDYITVGVTKVTETQLIKILNSEGLNSEGHIHDTSDITALTSYSKPSSTSALAATDSLNTALGKLEKALDGKAPTSHASTETTYGAASTSNYGHAKLSSSINSTSEALAATPKAVKTAYDLAAAAVPKSGGTMTGTLTTPGDKYFSTTGTRSCAINLKNSDIIGINGLYFEDGIDSAGEGINFYRSGTFSLSTTNLKIDRLFGANGVLYWDPNRGLDEHVAVAGQGDQREVITYGRGQTLYYGATVSRTKNYVLAAPNGSDGNASFRALVAADIPSLDASKITSGTLSTSRIPSLDASKITSGTLPISRGGTGTTTNVGLTSKVLTGGFVTAAIKATTQTIEISLSSVSTTTYTTFSTTVRGIILGTTSSPTDSAGALVFNGVTIKNNIDGTGDISVKAKKVSSQIFDPNTTISIDILSIPMS